MSNIVSWKSKKFSGFELPADIGDFFEARGFDVELQNHPMLGVHRMMIAELPTLGGVSIFFEDGKDFGRVMSIGIGGDCSGLVYQNDFREMFARSRGELEAELVWDDGRATRLHVQDGVIAEEPIDL